MLKIVLFIAFIGHILCGICDCLLSYSPSGRLDLKQALTLLGKRVVEQCGIEKYI